jgi:hypothetical protein
MHQNGNYLFFFVIITMLEIELLASGRSLLETFYSNSLGRFGTLLPVSLILPNFLKFGGLYQLRKSLANFHLTPSAL